MNDIESVETPAHQADEAPVSKELRNKATKNLETIKQLVTEARQAGTLTKEDEEALGEWLAQDVQAPLAQAEQHDAERQAVLASAAVNTAVEGVHVAEDLTVRTPAEHQEDLAYRQEHGHSFNEGPRSV